MAFDDADLDFFTYLYLGGALVSFRRELEEQSFRQIAPTSEARGCPRSDRIDRRNSFHFGTLGIQCADRGGASQNGKRLIGRLADTLGFEQTGEVDLPDVAPSFYNLTESIARIREIKSLAIRREAGFDAVDVLRERRAKIEGLAPSLRSAENDEQVCGVRCRRPPGRENQIGLIGSDGRIVIAVSGFAERSHHRCFKFSVLHLCPIDVKFASIFSSHKVQAPIGGNGRTKD